MFNLADTASCVNDIPVSVAKMTDATRRDYKTFEQVYVSDLDFLDVITSRVWSPIVYSGGGRRKANFLSSRIIAIDCDNGEIPLAEMIANIKEWGCWGAIGLTKSHQKQKGEAPPCDRFRVVFKMYSAISDREQYEYNFAQWVKSLKGDRGVKDAARYYFPCTEIAFKQFGDLIDFAELPVNYVREADRQKANVKRMDRHRNEQTLPMWVIRYVADGPPEGRHNISYAIGATLTELGYGVEEIVDYIMSGPISKIGREDVRRAVGNAASKIRG